MEDRNLGVIWGSGVDLGWVRGGEREYKKNTLYGQNEILKNW